MEIVVCIGSFFQSYVTNLNTTNQQISLLKTARNSLLYDGCKVVDNHYPERSRMRRMDGMSAFMLATEKPGAYQHTLKISVLDVSDIEDGWDFNLFRESIARRIHLAPMMRWKFLKTPFGLHHPVWVDDPDFDLAYHLRRLACPAPGDKKALCELISDMYARTLDPTKPLWLAAAVEGMADNTVVLIMLVHHAYTDGTGIERIMRDFFQASSNAIEPEGVAWHPRPLPSKFKLLTSALIGLPVTLAKSFPKIGKGIVNARKMRRKYEKSGNELPPNIFRDGRDSPFNLMLGHRRTFVYETFPLAEIRAISKQFNVSINDLFVAVAASAYRKFMSSRGYDVDDGPLVTAIPVGKRSIDDEGDPIGNKTSADYLSMPIHIQDPFDRLMAAHRAGNIMKAHIKEAEGMDFSSIIEITPPFIISLYEWMVKRKKGKFGIWGNAAISNVPGPREHLYLGKMQIKNWISMGQIFHGLGLNTTIWSYAGQLNLCILADQKLLPNGWELIEYFKDGFKQYSLLLEETQRLDALKEALTAQTEHPFSDQKNQLEEPIF